MEQTRHRGLARVGWTLQFKATAIQLAPLAKADSHSMSLSRACPNIGSAVIWNPQNCRHNSKSHHLAAQPINHPYQTSFFSSVAGQGNRDLER
jgi:predicted RNA-binding Zn-ribbon protein involved in translation (DUF1610 family)